MKLSKSKIPTELAQETGTKWWHVSRILKRLEKRGLVRCLNPKARVGKLFGITEIGREIRRILQEEKGEFYFYNEPSDLDYKLYGEIIAGIRKKAFIKAMDGIWRTRGDIRKRAVDFNKNIWRPHAYNVLDYFIQIGIAESTVEKKEILFRLNEKGQRLREQVMRG